MGQAEKDAGGWRERKRRETFKRISDTALKLFISQGYEATTLDAIAQASGIARRTFFYYFKSKEEILLAWQKELPEALAAAVLAESTDQSPLDALRNAHLKLIAHHNSDRAVDIDQIMRSSEQLRASSQAKYLQLERAAFEALCQLWPQPERREVLRVAAMASVGILRLAFDRWAQESGRRPLAGYFEEEFEALRNASASV